MGFFLLVLGIKIQQNSCSWIICQKKLLENRKEKAVNIQYFRNRSTPSRQYTSDTVSSPPSNNSHFPKPQRQPELTDMHICKKCRKFSSEEAASQFETSRIRPRVGEEEEEDSVSGYSSVPSFLTARKKDFFLGKIAQSIVARYSSSFLRGADYSELLSALLASPHVLNGRSEWWKGAHCDVQHFWA